MSQLTTDPEPVITSQPAASPPPTPKRKVSIANDPVSDNRYDNLGFEPCSKRKTSQVMIYVSLKMLKINDAKKFHFEMGRCRMYNAYDKKMEKGTMKKLNGVHID